MMKLYNYIPKIYYIIPFIFIANRGLSILAFFIFSLWSISKFKYNKDIIKQHYQKYNQLYFPLFIFNAYLAFNTIFISIDFSNSIGRLLMFNLITLFIFFFHIILKNDEKIINLNLVIKSFIVFFLFITIDTYFQAIFRFDIFGFEISSLRLTGPFKDEQIIGSFILKFMFFFLYFISLKKNKSYLEIYCPLFILLIIFLSGERIAILYGMIFFAIYFVTNVYKKYNFKLYLIPIFLLLIVLFNTIKVIKDSDLKSQIKEILTTDNPSNIIYEPNNKLDYITYIYIKRFLNSTIFDLKIHNSYSALFMSGIETWKLNKFFGVGMKNYRTECVNIKSNKNIECSTHPHNLLSEILSELGLFGLILFIYFILNILRYLISNFVKENYFIIFSILPALIPLINGSLFNSFNILIFAYQISLILLIINNQGR